MTDKLSVEEIAEDVIQKIRERNGLDHLYGVKDVKIALLSFAKQEAEPLVEALELAKRDIFEWEATAVGLRKLPPNQLEVMIQGTERGEKDSERVRHKIHEALTAHRQKYPKEKS